MDFVEKTDWQDTPSTATPITSAELLRMEAGIAEGARSASETLTGNVELATPAEMTAGSDLSRVPAVKRVADYVIAYVASVVSAATETSSGVVELATAAEMTAGTDLVRATSPKRVKDYVTSALSSLPGTAAATETLAGIVELATAAEMTAGTDLTRAPSVKRVFDYVASALTGKADKSGSVKQFADVSDTSFVEGDVPMFRSATSSLEPTDLDSNFAGLDSNLRLAPSAFPQFYVPTVIIEEGDVPPGTFPAYGLVGKLPAAASLIPTLFDVTSVRAANNVVCTLPETVAIGEYVGFSVAFSAEAPIDHISAAFGGTGPGAGLFDFGTVSIPNTTSGVLNGFVKVTTAAAAGSLITFTARDVANAAINRVHLIAAIYRLPNLVTSVPRDQQAISGGASSSVLTSIGATIGTNTAQPSEVVIGSASTSSGAAPNTRDIAGTNGWQTLANHQSDNGASGRRLYVGYRVLTTVGQPSLTTTVTLSGTATQTGAWAAKLDTFKGI